MFDKMNSATSLVREFTPSVFESGGRDGGQPLVLLFLGAECPASQTLERTIAQLAPAYVHKLWFVRVNATKATDLVRRYRIHYIPSLIVVHCEAVLYLAMGVLPKRELEAIFDAAARRSGDAVDSLSGPAKN